MPAFQNAYTMGVDYQMPLLYPDLQLGPLVYLKRVRADIFFDYGYGSLVFPEVDFFYLRNYASVGAELIFDFHVLRLFPEIEAGVRFSMPVLFLNNPVEANPSVELIFPVIRF